MAEISTKENEEAVARIYAAAMDALHGGEPISVEQRVIHDVEHMMQEANSGASFEQYFRWASLDEINAILSHLQRLGLEDVAALVTRAIDVAFPDGVPANEEEKSDATEWTAEQESALGELFEQLEEQNGRVTNTLGAYARRTGA